jgi:hypothetical protein
LSSEITIVGKCAVESWRVDLNVVAQYWLLSSNIGCWLVTLIFGGDGTPYSCSHFAWIVKYDNLKTNQMKFLPFQQTKLVVGQNASYKALFQGWIDVSADFSSLGLITFEIAKTHKINFILTQCMKCNTFGDWWRLAQIGVLAWLICPGSGTTRYRRHKALNV